MKRIGIFGNSKSLLIYLLLSSSAEIDKTLFLLEENLYSYRLKNKFCFTYKTNKNKILRYLDRMKIILICAFLNQRKKLKNLEVYGNDHIPIAFYFLKKHKFITIEDGFANYNLKTSRRNIEKRYAYRFPDLGRAKNVNKIYLTGLGNISTEIAKKVEIVNLQILWNKKNTYEKIKILKIFNLNKKKIKNISSKTHILFTQPLSEDGYLTEEEKIKLYKKIISKYNSKLLVIKKHPREKTNYEEIFPDIAVDREIFPSEILDLVGIKFEKVITLFSTAALGLGINTDVDFYGTEVHSKILENFGNLDNIMKRNCFLEDEQC